MLISLVVSFCLAAPGIKSATPLEDVKALDAQVSELVKAGPGLTAVLASEAELKQMLKAMKLDKETEANLLSSSLADQTPKPDLPATFAAVSAIVTKPDSSKTHTVYLYDGKSRLDLFVMRRPNKTLVLTSAPSHAAENELLGDLLLRRSDSDKSARDVSYFVKENGAWKSATLPAVTQEQCLERLRAPALAIAESEARYFKAHQTYTKSFSALDYDGSKFTAVATIKAGNATSFLGVVSMFGGEVSINESGQPVDTKPCTLAK